MPSSIKYLSVTFVEDYDAGLFVVPTGTTCSLPDKMARGLGPRVVIIGPGSEATRLTPPSSSSNKASPSMSATQLAQFIQTVGTSVNGAPWGVGYEALLEAGLYDAPVIDLPTGNSITGPGSGSAVLKFGKHSTVTAETGVLRIPDDLLQKRGIHGRGTLRSLSVDGYYDDVNATAFPVHGYYGVAPSNGGDIHAMEHVIFTKCTGSGIKVSGRDQLAGVRLKCNDNKRYGLELIDMNDSKLFAPGCNGNLLGAAYIEHCATPKFYGCDFGNPNSGFIGPFTVLMVNQARAGFFGGEIQGRIGIIGRSDQGTNQWEMTGNLFQGINFKIDGNLAPAFVYDSKSINALIYVEDTDGLTFASCKVQYNDNIPVDDPDSTDDPVTNTPDYFIQIGTNTGDADYHGAIRFASMSGIVHRRSRISPADDGVAPLLPFKKNVCNRPDLIEWDFIPGALELTRYISGSGIRTPPRNTVLAGSYGGSAVTYNTADLPMGALWSNLDKDLDNVGSTWSVAPAPYAPPSGYAFVMRVWP